MKAKLLLEEGSSFTGFSIGAYGEKIGEVVLNRGIVGYQELMTDSANAGKILVLTYPLIGNYGVTEKFNESRRCWIEGMAIKEGSRMYSNWQAEDSLKCLLKKENIVGIEKIDTRRLAGTIQDKGEMLGIISTEDTEKDTLLKKLKEYKKNRPKSFIKNISVKEPERIEGRSCGPNLAILDLGILNSFLKQLKILGCNITLLPYHIDAEEVLRMRPEGLIISSGPEEDEAILEVSKNVEKLLGKIPLLGISVGCEIIALALGGKVKRMKVGHHGMNYPVKPIDSYKGYITVQNHSFVVDEGSIKGRKDIKVTLYNVNDNSIEEIESKSLRFIAPQYYPSPPGFDEVHPLFTRFLNMLKEN